MILKDMESHVGASKVATFSSSRLVSLQSDPSRRDTDLIVISGGVIGTGLFVGSGAILSLVGPGSLAIE